MPLLSKERNFHNKSFTQCLLSVNKTVVEEVLRVPAIRIMHSSCMLRWGGMVFDDMGHALHSSSVQYLTTTALDNNCLSDHSVSHLIGIASNSKKSMIFFAISEKIEGGGRS